MLKRRSRSGVKSDLPVPQTGILATILLRHCRALKRKINESSWPGFQLRSPAWQAGILTTILSTLSEYWLFTFNHVVAPKRAVWCECLKELLASTEKLTVVWARKWIVVKGVNSGGTNQRAVFRSRDAYMNKLKMASTRQVDDVMRVLCHAITWAYLMSVGYCVTLLHDVFLVTYYYGKMTLYMCMKVVVETCGREFLSPSLVSLRMRRVERMRIRGLAQLVVVSKSLLDPTTHAPTFKNVSDRLFRR